jgi:hypothetical protein
VEDTEQSWIPEAIESVGAHENDPFSGAHHGRRPDRDQTDSWEGASFLSRRFLALAGRRRKRRTQPHEVFHRIELSDVGRSSCATQRAPRGDVADVSKEASRALSRSKLSWGRAGGWGRDHSHRSSRQTHGATPSPHHPY